MSPTLTSAPAIQRRAASLEQGKYLISTVHGDKDVYLRFTGREFRTLLTAAELEGNGEQSQLWEIYPDANFGAGYYTVQNVWHGGYVGGESSLTQGSEYGLYETNLSRKGDDNMYWQIEAVEEVDRTYQILYNSTISSSNWCLNDESLDLQVVIPSVEIVCYWTVTPQPSYKPAASQSADTTSMTASISTPSVGEGGLSGSDKIALGTGIGVGVPSLIIGVLALWLAYLAHVGRKTPTEGRNDVRKSISSGWQVVRGHGRR